MVTKIKDDLLNATDEDILHTSNKYVECQLKILNKNNLSEKEKGKIRINIDYVTSCVRANNITSLQQFLSEIRYDRYEFNEDECRLWFWRPLSIVS